MNSGPPRRRRARPVADAPVVELLARADDVTKGWLLALIEDAPLEEMPAILAAGVARDGPRLCSAVVRALADDTDLDRLRGGAALEPLAASAAALAGADGLEAAARAVDALHGVIWSAVRAELHDPAPDEIAELAERLALVIEHVRMAVLRSLEGRGPRGSAAAPTAAAAPHLAPAAPPETFEASGDTRFEPSGATRFEPSGDTRFEPPRDTGAAPEPLWVGALEDEIDRSHRTGTPLSLLLTELDEADRVLAVEGETMAESVFGRFAQSVRSAVRRQDTLACETDTRAWIIARDTGRLGAQALAERVVEAVHESPSWRGAPLGVTVGVAVLGEDGGTTSELIEAAEEDRFAAAASGIAITRGDQGDAGDDLPDADG